MSHAAKLSDAERTAEMLDLVRRKHEAAFAEGGMPPSYAVLEEVAPGTGWGAHRYADVLALGTWPSEGLKLHGYEIKASRADLKRELADPSKHEAVARFCHTWTLVVWEEKMLLPDIPEWWGITVTIVRDDERELKVVRKPQPRDPAEWTRTFVASMVRNAYQQGPRAAYVARACLTARERGVRDGEHIANNEWKRGLVHAIDEYINAGRDWRNREAVPDRPDLLAKYLIGKLSPGAQA